MPHDRTSRLIIGCGYLGRRVAQQWVSSGDDVYALTRSKTHAVELQNAGIRPLVGDVLDPHSLRAFPPVQSVMYAVGFDRTGAATKREVYVDGLRNVLTNLPASVEQVLYVSSTSVYGQFQGEWVDESSPCAPRTEGGQICLDAERLLESELHGRCAISVLRLSGLYGPDRLIARIAGLKERRPITDNPDGWLNLIHVDDAATTVIASAARREVGFDLLLASDDQPVRRRTYYETVARLAGAPAPTFTHDDEPSRDLGKRCCNRRLHESHRIMFKYPSIDEGLPG
ncbi:MAG: SDR family oxidoreductase, partial [Planctomycetaceae bacterium]|nr:SDR family oxidoreductase [Planctomycetaceae bacterium]